jgi:hypothetical protein
MLAAHHHGLYALDIAPASVLHGDLRFAVGAQIRQAFVPSRGGKLAAEGVRVCDCRGHKLGGLIAGVAEHHPLIAGARSVHTHCDIRALLVDCGQHGAASRVKPVRRIVVTYARDGITHDPGYIRVMLCCDLAHDQRHSGRHDSLARHP